MKSITRKDLTIVSQLRKNGRATLTSISRATGIPVSTLFDKIKENKHGIIKKHTVLLDFAVLGFSTLAHIVVKVGKHDRETVKTFLQEHPQVNSAYRINNGFDYLIEGVFKHMRDLEDFLEQLGERFSIQESYTYHIIDELKKEEFLSTHDALRLCTLG